MEAHTAAGKLQGLSGDGVWYEAAFVVGITNAMNVVADSLDVAALAPVDDAHASPDVVALFAAIRAFYECRDVPDVLRVLAGDPAYLRDFWEAVCHAFGDRGLTRRFKEALAFAVSVTTRSRFGAAFHLGEMRRLGVTDRGVFEVMGVTQMFSSYTKIADTLQLESDMRDIAPVDRTPAPGA